ncbi:putative methionine aminopeptidase, type i [Cardiosporidium cionae]|uniref:Methionine aminopeptidase n=1 Tax=Cardiosporidium cionae TaxID=476202 RepID=A0ABQ7J998_9APIC|nr:putative methionine aminopeptidase, type i [Cardiosporidium cionae]|eukprot:KAF8820571.1 putative methionine aminopeptidase, type i [Cardiosporidium cionae]
MVRIREARMALQIARPALSHHTLRRFFHSRREFLTPKLILRDLPSENDCIKSKPSSHFKPSIFEGQYRVLPPHAIPLSITQPEYAKRPSGIPEQRFPLIYGEVKTDEEIIHMKAAAKLAAECLRIAIAHSHEGVTTDEVDGIVHHHIISSGAYPSAVNFHGFPKSMCASPNEAACHGLPNTRPLQNGDLISYDCTVFLNGFHGDCAGTVEIGNASENHFALNAAAKESLMQGISAVKPGASFWEIGRAISAYIDGTGFSIVENFCGHFIGRDMHMAPLISHVFPPSVDGASDTMKVGQVFTIEPIICEGQANLRTWADSWTMVTRDNGRCAQWEHTVLVNEKGAEILTI